MKDYIADALIKNLVDDNRALRKAGCDLAEAAIYVAREYDGTHRLLLAVSEWAKAVADEGGRGRLHCAECSARFNTVWERSEHERTTCTRIPRGDDAISC